MRLVAGSFAAFVVLANVGVFSCDDRHHHDFDVTDDVTVEITGATGIDFDARFEDDRRFQTASGVIPFTADFTEQRNFFTASVDKRSSGTGQICVKLTDTRDSRQSCSTDPNAHISITIVF